MKIIVGLGNPGEKYRHTRHNLGAECVLAFAEKHGFVLKKEAKFQSFFSLTTLKELENKTKEIVAQEIKVALLLPLTYMNRSGLAVKKVLDFFKISSFPSNEESKEKKTSPSDILVVVDDVYLKFGTMRLRFTGSSGGHNGLKDIEANLGTKDYPRLKLGIGPQALLDGKLQMDVPLEEYVLDRFNSEEQKEIPQFLQKGIAAIESWLFEPTHSTI